MELILWQGVNERIQILQGEDSAPLQLPGLDPSQIGIFP